MANTVPPFPPPPYLAILDELMEGNVIPFLGAGASRVGYVAGGPGIPPAGEYLAETLALAAGFPSDGRCDPRDLPKVASYYEEVMGRTALRGRLHSAFSDDRHTFNSLHLLLAQIAKKKNQVIVTTNYDTLLEQAFQANGIPYDLAVYPADNKKYGNSLMWSSHMKAEATPTITPEPRALNELDPKEIGTSNLIYKIHGTVHADEMERDSFVITEWDFIQFLSRMSSAVPSAFKKYFSDKSFLFLGYALRDWNMRVLLNQIRKGRISDSGTPNPDRRSWAFISDPPPCDLTIWRNRNVTIFNVRLETFVCEMKRARRLRRWVKH